MYDHAEGRPAVGAGLDQVFRCRASFSGLSMMCPWLNSPLDSRV